MRDWFSFLFSGIQAVSAIVLTALAVWAAFFTNLPDLLITQLRTEIVEAKSEVTLLRQQRTKIEEERDEANRELSALFTERESLSEAVGGLEDELTEKKIELEQATDNSYRIQQQRQRIETELKALEEQRTNLISTLKYLREERELYADQTLSVNLNRVAAVACYRLSGHFFDANIAVNYGQHRTWLDTNREVSRRRPAYDALSVSDRYSASNESAIEFRRLESDANSLPKFWVGLPQEPSLTPNAEPVKMGSHLIKLLNFGGKEDFETTHRYLITLFFARTVQSEKVRELNTKAFVEDLKLLAFLENLLGEEREKLYSTLDKFTDENSELNDLTINVVFKSEPTAAEIPIGKHEIVDNLERLRDRMKVFFSKHGVNSFGECQF
ncbi:MAG: hypothetical protein ACPGGK_04825 [Pikeienuella sp.]